MSGVNGKLTSTCPLCETTWHVLRMDYYGRYEAVRARYCPGCGKELERKART
jgi:endogenous inhibitor of DNA gyrase (YacG/DUF329 family)